MVRLAAGLRRGGLAGEGTHGATLRGEPAHRRGHARRHARRPQHVRRFPARAGGRRLRSVQYRLRAQSAGVQCALAHAHLPDDATLVWKTNAHGSSESRAFLDGVFDVWLADYKFGNDDCAARLARVPNYSRVVRENLLWAQRDHDLIVRHLLMPGHAECCWRPIAAWIAENLPTARVSLRDGFWPSWQARTHSELRGTCTVAETQQAHAIAAEFSLSLIR